MERADVRGRQRNCGRFMLSSSSVKLRPIDLWPAQNPLAIPGFSKNIDHNQRMFSNPNHQFCFEGVFPARPLIIDQLPRQFVANWSTPGVLTRAGGQGWFRPRAASRCRMRVLEEAGRQDTCFIAMAGLTGEAKTGDRMLGPTRPHPSGSTMKNHCARRSSTGRLDSGSALRMIMPTAICRGIYCPLRQDAIPIVELYIEMRAFQRTSQPAGAPGELECGTGQAQSAVNAHAEVRHPHGNTYWVTSHESFVTIGGRGCVRSQVAGVHCNWRNIACTALDSAGRDYQACCLPAGRQRWFPPPGPPPGGSPPPKSPPPC